MRITLLVVLTSLILFSCQSATTTPAANAGTTKTTATYKPGFGEFMSAIQAHHIKLWLAGNNDNWPLADFELSEIKEIVEDIKTYQQERQETKHLDMLTVPLDSMDKSIKDKNPTAFKRNFIYLTNTCNNCHHEVNFEFNRVKIPDGNPFVNQDFSVPGK